MKHKKRSIFDQVIKEVVPQSDHDLSYGNQCTLKTGLLYPVALYETVPGDVFFGGSAAFLRTQPLVAPLYTPLDMEIRYFWVPNRFVWSNWREFLTDQVKGKAYGDLSRFEGSHPHLDFRQMNSFELASWCADGTLADFMGIPSHYDGLVPINALPFRMYNLIWNEFFRDENLMDPAPVFTTDGDTDNDALSFHLRRVCWRKDRFTSALPWPQKGEDVNIDTLVKLYGGDPHPDSDLVDVTQPRGVVYGLNGQGVGSFVDPSGFISTIGGQSVNTGRATQIYRNSPTQSGNIGVDGSTLSSTGFQNYPLGAPGNSNNNLTPLFFDPNGSLSSNISVRRIRQASALQRILEKKALAGSRYSEYILAMYGVRIPDAENERPVYLGGGRNPITVSPVEQMSSTDNTSPQGNLVGKGVATGSFRLNRPYLFNDFGYLMGVGFIRPQASYKNGLRRSLFKFDRDDYYNPDYQLIGEELVDRREIYYRSNYADNDFGYQSRYAWLKSRENEIHGDFRGNLATWVMPHPTGQNPMLNATFVACNPTDGINFAVKESDHYLIDLYNGFHARRPMYYLPMLKNGQL